MRNFRLFCRGFQKFLSLFGILRNLFRDSEKERSLMFRCRLPTHKALTHLIGLKSYASGDAVIRISENSIGTVVSVNVSISSYPGSILDISENFHVELVSRNLEYGCLINSLERAKVDRTHQNLDLQSCATKRTITLQYFEIL